MSPQVERLMKLFQSAPDMYGTHGEATLDVNKTGEKTGKLTIKASAKTLRGAVTPSMWMDHLEGVRPLGLIPLLQDFTCVWGAIDIDDYTIPHADIIQRVKREKLPLIACRTKSGGVHLYAFLSKPMDADKWQKKLGEWASILGFGKSEIFPKQTHCDWADHTKFCNWINMPYLSGDKTDRYAMGDSARGLTLNQFLDMAEKAKVDPADVEKIGKSTVDPEFKDAPPCLATLVANKFNTGNHNDGLMALAVFAKKKYPDQWGAKLHEWAAKHFDGPVERVDELINSNTTKDYNYRCTLQPIAQFCNAGLCKTKKYGVGGGSGLSMPTLSNLAVINSDEPVWSVEVNGQVVQVDTDNFFEWRGLQKAILVQTKQATPIIKPDTWMGVVAGLLDSVMIVEVPQEVTRVGQFNEILEQHCTDRHRAEERDEITLGKAWLDEETKRIYFRLKDIQELCDNRRFKGYTRTQMGTRIRELGGDTDFLQLRGKGVNVWWLPVDLFSVHTEPLKVKQPKDSVL